MGGKSTPSRAAVVQSAGQSLRLNAEIFLETGSSIKAGAVACTLLAGAIPKALITQMSQNRRLQPTTISLDQQLCRWLLLSLDRLKGDETRDDGRN